MLIKLSSIKDSTAAQLRVADPIVADLYAVDMAHGATFPSVVLFDTGNGDYVLADGFQRVRAAKAIKRDSIEADIRQPAQGETAERSAILYAAGANAQHGSRRTNKDKRNAVKTLLQDDEWSCWSDSEIARQCRVDRQLVANVRDQVINTKARKIAGSRAHLRESASENPARKYRDKAGNVRQMRTGNIGKKSKVEPKQQSQECARIAGAFSVLAFLERAMTGREAFEQYGDLANADAAIRFVAAYAEARKKSNVA